MWFGGVQTGLYPNIHVYGPFCWLMTTEVYYYLYQGYACNELTDNEQNNVIVKPLKDIIITMLHFGNYCRNLDSISATPTPYFHPKSF